MKRTLVVMLVSSFVMAIIVSSAWAEDSLFIPLPCYRTGPFAASGTPICNGMRDYLTMLNERDGGIGGVPISIAECETSYDGQKSIECYDSFKSRHPLFFNPWQTGATLAIIPKAAVDKIPVLSVGYGLSASAVGDNFPWVFIPPDTYWDSASVFMKYVAAREAGYKPTDELKSVDLKKLKGKKIAFVYIDIASGREFHPILKKYAAEYGFTLSFHPVPLNQLQSQASQWMNIRREKPDWVLMLAYGAMYPTAVKEAVKILYPMDRIVCLWYTMETDAQAGGARAKGLRTLNFHSVGNDFPAMKDILKYVVDAGKSEVRHKTEVGKMLYNRGVYNSVLMAEAIRNAQKISGKKVVDSEDVRQGLETLEITTARWKEIGLEGFAPELKLSCSDHSGHQRLVVQEWDGKAFIPASSWIPPMKDVVRPMLEKAAEDYVSANQPWPERDKPCR